MPEGVTVAGADRVRPRRHSSRRGPVRSRTPHSSPPSGRHSSNGWVSSPTSCRPRSAAPSREPAPRRAGRRGDRPAGVLRRPRRSPHHAAGRPTGWPGRDRPDAASRPRSRPGSCGPPTTGSSSEQEALRRSALEARDSAEAARRAQRGPVPRDVRRRRDRHRHHRHRRAGCSRSTPRWPAMLGLPARADARPQPRRVPAPGRPARAAPVLQRDGGRRARPLPDRAALPQARRHAAVDERDRVAGARRDRRAAVPRRHGRGQHRAARAVREAAAPGQPRPAHRARQPRAVHRAAARGVRRGRPGSGSASATSTSTGSRRSTTRSATWSATSCSSRSAERLRPAGVTRPAGWWRAWAATSSWCWSSTTDGMAELVDAGRADPGRGRRARARRRPPADRVGERRHRGARRCPTSTPLETMRDADVTLHWAKVDGKNRWACYDPERNAREIARITLSAAMPAALERERVLRRLPADRARWSDGQLLGRRGAGALGAPGVRPARARTGSSGSPRRPG